MDLIGKRVDWHKVKGKKNASMIETKGFGSLYRLELDRGMVITGDYGVATTKVLSIEVHEDGIEVTTKNSVYLINPWRKK